MPYLYKETYCFADIPVSIAHNYDYLTKQCRDYIYEGDAALTLEITQSDIDRERERAEVPGSPAPYLESLACYRKLCESILKDGVLLFHCSAIAVDGVAYLFAAPSGTGKSTHTALWRRVFGDRAVMVNDDKPLLRISDEGVLVYGTPWDGKHHLSNNICLPVGGICHLSRGEENSISRVSCVEGFTFLLSQTFRPDGVEGTERMLKLVGELSTRVPLWSLACNMSEQAAELSYTTMKRGKTI